jgi:hypothetical protein
MRWPCSPLLPIDGKNVLQLFLQILTRLDLLVSPVIADLAPRYLRRLTAAEFRLHDGRPAAPAAASLLLANPRLASLKFRERPIIYLKAHVLGVGDSGKPIPPQEDKSVVAQAAAEAATLESDDGSSSSGSTQVTTMPQLERLELLCGDDSLNALRLPELRRARLLGPRLTLSRLDLLSQSTALRKLVLYDLVVDDDALAPVLSLPRLQSLFVSHCLKVTGRSLGPRLSVLCDAVTTLCDPAFRQ